MIKPLELIVREVALTILRGIQDPASTGPEQPALGDCTRPSPEVPPTSAVPWGCNGIAEPWEDGANV